MEMYFSKLGVDDLAIINDLVEIGYDISVDSEDDMIHVVVEPMKRTTKITYSPWNVTATAGTIPVWEKQYKTHYEQDDV